MAFSSVASNFLSPSSGVSPSQSLFFLELGAQTRSLQSFRPRKLRISCCQKTVQLENETKQKAYPVKKKRKPRPSFLEQVQSKWSIRTPPLRENFPWQEEESGGTNQEFEAQRSVFSRDVSSEEESEKSSCVSEPERSQRINKSILAPWVHGNGRKNVFNSEGSRNIQENVHPKDDGLHGIQEHWPNEDPLVSVVVGYEDLVKEVTENGRSEEEVGEFDDIPIGLSEKNEILGNEESEDFAAMEDLSTISLEISSEKCSNDANDLMRLPWERKIDEEFVKEEKSRNRNTELAERLIPEPELKRLRNVSLRMVERMKVGAAGVTQALVDAIHEKWKHEEVVKLKFEGPPSKNMRRTHEILESRTGGLVIWRSGSSVVLYRGMTYKLDCVKSYSKHVQGDAGASGSSQEDSPESIKVKRLNGAAESFGVYNSKYYNSLSQEEQMDLSELDLLLHELGPRFIDWSGREPLPVDADLLPAVVPGFKSPFRLLPYGTRQALRDKEMTYLRRTARLLPPHFALGRNRDLQGLAMAMVKLWEKSAIAKIAIKRGVPNTSNERMAEELKILTGGTLVSRNKEFIVFYRGNDFLPPGVSSALIEAERSTALQQDEEEQARQRAAMLIDPKAKASKQPLVAGTLAETIAATSRWGTHPNSAEKEKMMRDAAVARHASMVDSLQRKLAIAKSKIGKAERALQKVLQNQEPESLPTDLETLTDEERFLFRRIGLSMKPYLLLGRREVFDGTIENMHLHWKYRELVKIIVERKTFSQVKHIAVSLEAESGGVLVSMDKTTKGYAIIVYRGKNYQRPLTFRPRNLLTKRQALARSIELQRREALKHHILELEENLEKLKQELEEMVTANNNGGEALALRTDAAASDCNDDEDEETEYNYESS
ncbi:CRM-domain containing factor CFM3, chloroplastic/mitochondrial [Sesamum indicum]|uniref:CRM-domain containing factor CFM3, chloroplastic/mitochondrial n=1 Tax=Sesamum indicum TaxID=4182 RepID=A0A6I9UHN6_SESIN|nr:CRM-domain containing factor CFM3, chloroplastic/mitochondrial [Sesamum indicum]